MIQEKTRGNLSSEETGVLRNALTHLQMAFVEVSQDKAAGGKGEAAQPPAAAVTEGVGAGEAEAAAPAATPEPNLSTAADEQRESKKRFSKSYGG